MKKKSSCHPVRRNFEQGGFFKLRVVLGVLLGFAAVAVVLFALGKVSAQPGTSSGQVNKIAPEVMADTSNGGFASVVILLAHQADVNAAYGMKDQDARGWFVYNTLTQYAERTQAGIRNFLNSRGIAYHSFWAANMLVATLDRTLVEAVAARSDVARVDSNRPTHWIEDPSIANFGVTSSTPDVVEWGVQNVNAPQVWALGYTGQGIVIGNQDTGMRWTHSALKPHYRGWNGVTADHNYNWHDSIHSGGGSCGPDNLAPCDDNGHGTHTTGTTSGDDGAGNQVGVAPGAQWIGCRNMDQGNGTPATYTECFQFFIAPTDLNGQNPNPALRPHVMNNSWGCPVSEGCTTRGELETVVNNTQAAGIFVEVSAGNSGPGCSSVTDPAAIYEASFSTGAIDISNSLASFSSRGPSTFYTPALLKPNVSAPGVNVRSSTRTSDTSYGNLSGTSMAGPHVVGVVALLWSARPQLIRDIAATKTILQNTANPAVTVSPPQTCDGIPNTQIPNNSFGYGRVDALAAVNSVPQGTPTPTPTASPTPTATATASPTPTPCGGQYVIDQIGGSIVLGTTDTGNHTDDGTTFVSLPFSYTLYDQIYTGINVDSDGTAQFVGPISQFGNTCLPWTSHSYLMFPYWDDLRTDAGSWTCTPGPCGIFTSVSGSAPNRIFNIEWRTVYYNAGSGSGNANFELRLYEGQSRFDVIYGNVTNTNSSATAGVQKNDTTFVQYFCSGTGGAATGGQSYVLQPCGTPSPTPTATATATATVTPQPSPSATVIDSPTPTPTATATATATSTPRFVPTPRPRPTPWPRP